MRTRLTLAIVLLLVSGAFGQESAKLRPAVLLHGSLIATPDNAGYIHGLVVDLNGRPAKGIPVSLRWLCPDDPLAVISSTTTNEAGEFLFKPVSFGKYDLSVGFPFPWNVSPPKFVAIPVSQQIELSFDRPFAEAQFQVREDVPHK